MHRHSSSDNRYLFHWMKTDKLARFATTGTLRPSWTHWIVEMGQMVRGTSTCMEPMLWNPDDEKPGEPCIVIDRQAFDLAFHLIDSGRTYNLTKRLKEAMKAGRDTGPVLEHHADMSSRSFGTPDEKFVTSAIPWSSVAAIGYERERLDDETAERIAEISRSNGLPLIDMSDWLVGIPSFDETDTLVGSAISSLDFGQFRP